MQLSETLSFMMKSATYFSFIASCLVRGGIAALNSPEHGPQSGLVIANLKSNSALEFPIATSQAIFHNDHDDFPVCSQTVALYPKGHTELDHALDDIYSEEVFQLGLYLALSEAIRIPTEVYDDLGPLLVDPRWRVFEPFHKYLETRFHLLENFAPSYSQLSVEKVNSYGLVFHWQGSNPSLKPLLLTAHQDVVPVDPDTIHQWRYPPFSGHYDGEWIWGRGSVDDKADLISLLTAAQELVKIGFKPARTVVFAIGFDEEASGLEGAGRVARYLESAYGASSFAMIVDEGSGNNGPRYGDGIIFASPGVSEKGYMDVRIEVSTSGGHSSRPPAHTSIGFLSRMIVALEDHLPSCKLARNSTVFAQIQCAAAYGPDFTPHLRRLVEEAQRSDDALNQLQAQLLELNIVSGAMLSTTQAIDLIGGGVKVNALPENAWAIVNYRIAEDSSVTELKQHITTALHPVAMDFSLTLDAFGETHRGLASSQGLVRLSSTSGNGLEPSPVTPVVSSGPWKVLAGTIKAIYGSNHEYDNMRVIITPELQLGNTDTQYYWNLTKHIMRYSHRNAADMYNGLHTVNEAVHATSVLEQVRFYTKLILNCDESVVL